MKVAIIIPNWNGSEKLQRNLPKVIEAAKDGKISEIIVTDDASTDDSVQILKDKFPEVRVIESGKNKNAGFSSNVNLGVSKTEADLIVLLNSDASLEKGFLKFALPHFEDPKIFSVGMGTGGAWSYATFDDGYFWHHQADPEKVDFSKPHQTLWASGGSGIFRKSVWDEIGGLDTLMDPFYGEDLDLGYRATKRGYVNIWEPRSKVQHYHEVGVISANFSQETINNTAERNNLILIWKNITDPLMIKAHKKALLRRLLYHPKYWLIFLAALKKYPQIMEKRKIERKHAKLTDQEVFALFKDS